MNKLQQKQSRQTKLSHQKILSLLLASNLRFLVLIFAIIFAPLPSWDSKQRIITLSFVSTSQAEEVNEKLNEEDVYHLLNRFSSVINVVKNNYYEDINSSQLIDLAIKGMLTKLDPYSSYFSKEEFEDFNRVTTGKYGGLGLTIVFDSNYIKVVSSFDGTPAFRAGIKTDDYITKVNGKSLRGVSTNDAANLMRGEPGTKLTITIARQGEAEFDVELIREIITIPNVVWYREGDVGYVRIAGFDNQAASGLEAAIKGLMAGNKSPREKTKLDKPVGFILDLRNNPGGLLSMAIEVADTFLNQGEIVSTRGRNNNDVSRYNATDGDAILGLPLIILINKGSASASEVVSGALKDHQRAKLLGIKSYGKASVQSVLNIGEKDDGVIKLTIKRYYTPKGDLIHEIGVNPDIVVETLDEVPENLKVEGYRDSTNSDNQLLKALEILHKK